MTLLEEPLKKSAKTLYNFLFNFYGAFLRMHFGNSCQFHPTCSNYARAAFNEHHFLKASYLTTGRLLRCHPFARGGYDPIPHSKESCCG